MNKRDSEEQKIVEEARQTQEQLRQEEAGRWEQVREEGRISRSTATGRVFRGCTTGCVVLVFLWLILVFVLPALTALFIR